VTHTVQDLAATLSDVVSGRTELVALLIGAASAVVDNVPLVAATMGMYDLEQVSWVRVG
jgi:Na+/H+ antiporter NhaD/arsenite permease-like protein